MMPVIVSQMLHIDLFGQGIETAITQMIDIVSEKSILQSPEGFQNIRSYVIEQTNLKILIEFRAEIYMEPQSYYAVLVNNIKDDLKYKALEAGFYSDCVENITLNNGLKGNLILLSRSNPTSPNFPFIIEIESKKELNILAVLKAVARNNYVQIPLNGLNVVAQT